MLLVGIDGGNNTVISCIDGSEPIIIPTVYSKYKYVPNSLGKKKSLKDSLDVEIEIFNNNRSKNKNLGRFFVGKMAKDLQNSNIKVRDIGSNKANDEGLLICMLTSLALATITYQKKESGSITQDIQLVTGLPYTQFENDYINFINQFKGSHKVTFRGNYDYEVTINIQDGEVEIEGAGALNELIFDKEDKYIIPAEKLVNKIILGIEIGEGTSEIMALRFDEDENGHVLPDYHVTLCTGIEKGTIHAKQPIIEMLRVTCNSIVDRFDIDFCLNRTNRKGILDLENGEEFNVVDSYKEQLNLLSDTLISTINNKIKESGVSNGSICHILIYGGGACVLDYYLGNLLKDKLSKVINTKITSSIVPNPHLANAKFFLEKAKIIFGEDK